MPCFERSGRIGQHDSGGPGRIEPPILVERATPTPTLPRQAGGTGTGSETHEEASMGSKELQALVDVLQEQLALGRGGYVSGSWTIQYDKERSAFMFNKCEDGVYCEERPAVIRANCWPVVSSCAFTRR